MSREPLRPELVDRRNQPGETERLGGTQPLRALCECSARSVSAAAMPLGKRSCSMLIICRFIGIAIVTPRTARKNTQASISGTGSEC